MTTSSKHLSKILIVILGVMTAFGPLTIDMYGPSLPKVQHAFGSSISEIQLTLSFAMIGLAIGQFVFGPLSDVLGRKKMALILLIGYLIASLLSVFTVHLTIFLIIRLIQGLAGGGAIVIAKASIGDNYDGDELAKFLTSLMVINGIITIIAPLLIYCKLENDFYIFNNHYLNSHLRHLIKDASWAPSRTISVKF